MSKAEQRIRRILKKGPLTTYELAKQAGVSWATANVHCYILKADGILDCRNEERRLGMKRVVWWVKGEA